MTKLWLPSMGGRPARYRVFTNWGYTDVDGAISRPDAKDYVLQKLPVGIVKTPAGTKFVKTVVTSVQEIEGEIE